MALRKNDINKPSASQTFDTSNILNNLKYERYDSDKPMPRNTINLATLLEEQIKKIMKLMNDPPHLPEDKLVHSTINFFEEFYKEKMQPHVSSASVSFDNYKTELILRLTDDNFKAADIVYELNEDLCVVIECKPVINNFMEPFRQLKNYISLYSQNSSKTVYGVISSYTHLSKDDVALMERENIFLMVLPMNTHNIQVQSALQCLLAIIPSSQMVFNNFKFRELIESVRPDPYGMLHFMMDLLDAVRLLPFEKVSYTRIPLGIKSEDEIEEITRKMWKYWI